MSQQEANELARSNYAIEAFTLGEENFLQIRCGEEVLVTVCAPEGKPFPDEFIVYNGTGMNDEDEEDTRLVAKRFPVKTTVNDAWREAARFGYLHGLSKLMLADARAEKESYEDVWSNAA